MAGYSGTPLAKKLGIKDGHTVGLIGAPSDFEATLAPLPDDVTIRRQARGAFDVIVFFPSNQADLQRRFMRLARRMVANGGLWVGWPKKASGVATDVTEDTIRRVALPLGLVDVKVCAVDDIWSGLKLVIRKELRK